ncbi:endonuclease/exonuclease/phosphatase family protein [Tunicatimonas pelagia]|uniref:endonuclease/exonuclease/phosphatase family protein n=1 Tax=Tunicatimonas pelagia TaxID=931531 RepID=UPI00266689C2|nr:endonuclease/exonuclease/phosphatase family protein [Tunicatimonas pelagia]WKN45545.1 endonuclease/exonuclease/phosphatase family protein [Tunicatimonas pelagia]
MGKSLNIFLFIFTLIAYLSPYVSPAQAWLAGFFSMIIPGLLLLHAFLLAYYITQRKKWYLFSLVALVLGYQYLLASFTVSAPSTPESTPFSVLSYNVRVFNTYAYFQNENEPGKSMINWLTDEDADIKCLQEYYNNDQSSTFNTTDRLEANGTYHRYVNPNLVNRVGAEFGLAIFSRYPILRRGSVALPDSTHFGIYTDLKIKQDTVRVYNVHLQSMSIDERDLSDLEGVRNNYSSVFHKLKHGFVSRAGQIDRLVEHLQTSPHPVIVCGDFNDLPYSYTYFTLRQWLHNAFERAGNGLGFSYNGRLFFLRIDNQFYSKSLKAHSFKTIRKVTFSDHFPVVTQYSFTKN